MIERFNYRGSQWYIRPARQLTRDRTPAAIDVAEFAPMLHTLVTVDTSHINCDLTDPVLVCDLTSRSTAIPD
ncbi:MAG TPA: hypothetical protein VLL82_15095 [Mycobacterium sp.]|nr:hypothetical protein [Mycobacterium sp.]